MSTELREALEQVARRYRHVRLWNALAFCWLTWACIGWVVSVVAARPGNEWVTGERLLGTLAGLAIVSALASAAWALRSARNPRWVARRIEAKHSELGTGLLAAVEEAAAAPGGRLGFLQSAVIHEALAHRRRCDWTETVSTRRLHGTQAAHAIALACLVMVGLTLAGQNRSLAETRAALAAGGDAYDIKVDPGNTKIERGTTLLVVARFQGAVPPDATLVVEEKAGSRDRRGMTRSLEDPTFAGRVDSVENDLAYHVEYAGRSTETFKVRVFEYPELVRADARLVFPAFTGLETKIVEDVRHVTAVEGTELTLSCRLNKEVGTARLVDEAGQAIDLALAEKDTHTYRATLTLAETHRYRVQLVDREGRQSKVGAEIAVNVTRNRPPVVAMAQPNHDVRVSPLEELNLKAKVEDDYGVVRRGLTYTLAGHEPRDIVLPAGAKPERKVVAEHMLDFESLKAQPDQLVTYFFWAEDLGPDGKPRRTSGDMYFAEVRPFEEIFRQGEQPPGESAENESEQSENGQEAERLAELQKEIINGTWKLIRREILPKLSSKFAEDSKTLQESQHSAIEQAGPMGERLRDAKSKQSLDQAIKAMKEAETHLGEALKTSSVAPHRLALAAEQAAYQALLRLRAREYEVIRNNSRQRGRNSRSGGNPMQRQLQQLQLSSDENRYEQQSTARSQEQQSKRERERQELRQVLNRLRELAQRQNDLNDRVKEMQSALEAAKTPQAREEIERQLKRLRDQQQEILRDTDELRERMESEENRDRMAEARPQIEQGREHVRQASEALEQGRLSQAVTEGARAGNQLNNLRDELRKNTADRFSQEMTDMRREARRIDQTQKQLSEQLASQDQRPQRSLRDKKDDRAPAQKGLEQQGKDLDQLLERMRNTVQEAEDTEPLLAKSLFDTVREAAEQKIPDALKVAEQLAEAGIAEDAAKMSQRAGEGIERVRQGVERAAESVLGDETAALRRAQGELDDLADAIDREIAQATGQEQNARRGNARRPAERPATKSANQPRTKDQQGERNGQPAEGEAQDQGQNRDEQNGPQGQPQDGPRGQRSQQGQQRAGTGERRPPGQQAKGGNQPGQRQQQGQQGQDGGNPQGQQQQQGQDGQPGQGGGNPQGQQDAQGQQAQGGGNPQGQQDRQGRAGSSPPRGGDLRQGRQAGGGGGPGRGEDLDRLIDGLTRGAPGGPITGEGFRRWSDRMRDVEELLEDPDLRAEAARIRDRVRGAREELRRHSKMPDWTKLQDLVADPLVELRNRVAEEVRKRESPDSLVPIDRDPVPPQYAEGVRRYYERLGSGR